MSGIEEQDELEATDEQLASLRELGVAESELEDLSFADAEDWIARLRAMRDDAGRVGRR